MKIYLAPMEGLADFYLRKLIARTGGYDLVVTEFIRVVDQLLPVHVFYRNAPELHNKGRTDDSTPVRLQLLGNQPEALALNALRAIELGSQGVDLNFGCPSKTVNKSKGGAVLLNEPETLYQVVKAVKNALPAGHITSAKMRLGFNDNNLMAECADAIVQAGADELTIHARTKAQGYVPPAYWHLVGEFRARIPIPVIINGEIWNNGDARRALTESKCDHLMLGRGAIRQPWLAQQIKDNKEDIESWPMMLLQVREFWALVRVQMGEKYCSGRLKQWLHYLKEIYPQANVLFIDIRRLTDIEAITSRLERE
jgi:tRNA-dihydrouridine synthase C